MMCLEFCTLNCTMGDFLVFLRYITLKFKEKNSSPMHFLYYSYLFVNFRIFYSIVNKLRGQIKDSFCTFIPHKTHSKLSS